MEKDRRDFLRCLAAVSGSALAGAMVPAAAQSRFLTAVTLGGFDLYYEVHGEGRPVVFAHGAGGTHLSWWQQVPMLSEHVQCITFDHRGFGYSRDAAGGPGRTAFVEDLRGLLDQLGIEKASLVGQSMGGWTSLGFASKYPERVEALVLCDTPGGYSDPEVAELMAERPDEPGAFAASFADREPDLTFLYREIQRSTLDRTPEGAPRSIGGLLGATTDIGPVVEHAIPTLFIVGEEDSIFPPAALRAMHRKMPGSEFALVEGAGHSVYFEKPAVFNHLVLDFLQRQVLEENG